MSFGAVAAIGGAVIGASASSKASKSQANSAADATAAQREMFDKQVELQAPFRNAGLTANNRLMYLLGLSPGGSANPASSRDDIRASLMPQFSVNDPNNSNGVDDYGLDAATDAEMARLQSGQGGYGSLMRNFSMADFEADPGYAFRMSEGTKAVEGGAAARGGLLSGAAQKALQKYGQESASQEYGNAFNRFTGQQTNQYNRLAGIVNTGQGATNQVSNAAGQFGQQQASNIIGAGNAQAAGQIGQANALVGGINTAFNGYQNNKLMEMIRKPGVNMGTATGADMSLFY